MKDYEKKILDTALYLISQDSKTTTLDVKEVCINTWDQLWWTQDQVSMVMDKYHKQFGLTYSDNGMFRTYYYKAKKEVAKVSRKKILKALVDRAGEEVTISWIAKDQLGRTKAGKLNPAEIYGLGGYMLFYIDGGKLNNVDPRTVSKAEFSNQILELK